MNAIELHEHGLLDARGAIIAALIADGWGPAQANAVLAEYTGTVAPPSTKAKWSRWTPAELIEVDKVIADAGGRLPSLTIIRPLADALGRSPKSVIAQIERRIAATSNAGSTSAPDHNSNQE